MTLHADTRARAPMLVAYVVTFIAFADTFSLLPTIGPYAAALGATGFGMGLALGAYSVTDSLFNIVGGVLLDRAGRRRMALTGFGIVTIAVLAYPLANSVEALVGIRLLHGIGGGILIPAIYTLIGDRAHSGARGRAMGRVGAIIGTAAVIAPGIAGAVRSRYGFDAVFIGLGIVMALGFVITATKVTETYDGSSRSRDGGVSLASLLQIKSLRIACISVFGFTVGFGSLSAFLPSRLEDMGYSPALSGGLFTALALVAVVLMLTRVASRVDSEGPRRPVLLGLPVIAVSLLLIGFSDHVAAITAGVIVFGAGFGIVYPAVSGATAAAAATPGRGRAFGIFSVCYTLGFAIGPPLLGLLQDRTGFSPFLAAAGVSVATIATVTLVSRETTPTGPGR